jgi:hypothetical protein
MPRIYAPACPCGWLHIYLIGGKISYGSRRYPRVGGFFLSARDGRESIIRTILSTNLVSFLYEPCAIYAPYACSARRLMARSSIRARTALPALIISHQ